MEAQNLTIVVLGSLVAGIGLISGLSHLPRFKMTEGGKELCAIVTYVSVGLALILGQVWG